VQTFEASGVRFDLAANFLAEQSPGFPWASALLRSANAFERLWGVLAISTLSLAAQGTAVATQGRRRGGDVHGVRGQRALTIGWHGVTLALSRGDELITRMPLSADADPAPAVVSNIQHAKRPQLFVTWEVKDAVA
jgi:hypothetical protein